MKLYGSIRAMVAAAPMAAAAALVTATAATALVLPAPICAQTASAVVSNSASPLGRWKTIDDATGKVKSIVAIREVNGTLSGTIEQLFDPPVPHPTCYLCKGAKKDVPLVGLQVLWGFRADGSTWTGGMVLDPETGKIYRGSLALEDGGKQLRLHGYIGIPLLGRTEHWVRAE
jgi:uncharacterized protein (DUF2147 family)